MRGAPSSTTVTRLMNTIFREEVVDVDDFDMEDMEVPQRDTARSHLNNQPIAESEEFLEALPYFKGNGESVDMPVEHHNQLTRKETTWKDDGRQTSLDRSRRHIIFGISYIKLINWFLLVRMCDL
jgi:uridine kinase